jgi:predicted 3-demethylubiquinone-9 3-methyltransferase (glyoxalase superfamily)
MTSKPFTTCLWFGTQGEEAAQYYTSIFRNSRIGRAGRYTESGPGRDGPLQPGGRPAAIASVISSATRAGCSR